MENKIFDYIVLEAEGPNKITEFVKEHIALGFQPVGSVTVITDEKPNRIPRIVTTFYQTLVKYSSDK